MLSNRPSFSTAKWRSLITSSAIKFFKKVKIEKKDVEYIELEIDRLNKDLPELKNFVIPGGHKTSSYSHVCRSICRRAERKISELNNKSSVDSNILAYVNRLSDFFFVLSRFLKHSDNVSESHW